MWKQTLKPWRHPSATVSVLAVAVLVCAAPVAAQRVSLADRVALLEQRAIEASTASSNANIELLNQITELRTELRALRGQIETLQQQNEQLKASARTQVLDLDERLQALERAGEPPLVIAAPEGEDPAITRAPPSAQPPAPVVGVSPVHNTATVANAASTGDDAAEPAADPAQERAQYEIAFDALKSGRYSEAARLFQQFLHAFPAGAYAANACYWLGESYYVVEDYPNAQAQFETVIARWPEHDKTPGALLKIGLSQHGQKQYDQAEATLLEVGQRYPGTDAARVATERLRAIQFSRLN